MKVLAQGPAFVWLKLISFWNSSPLWHPLKPCISGLLLNIELSSCKRLKKKKIGWVGMMKSALGQSDLKMSENGHPLGFYLFVTLQELLCCALESDL